MNELTEHELFEIEVLEKLKNEGFLEPLVFGGGTMLRLCYELNRYSVDLDFWFIKKVEGKKYFDKLKDFLEEEYEVTNAQIKFHTLLFEIRSKFYSKRLKIEIRKLIRECDYQEKIAFTKNSNKQVILKVHTLQQAMKNKIEAALDRGLIRDFFDIEFLLRNGMDLPKDGKTLARLKEVAQGFKKKDFKVTLGSILALEDRKYYVENGFEFLIQKIPV